MEVVIEKGSLISIYEPVDQQTSENVTSEFEIGIFFQISVATFHLGRIEMGQQTIGRNSCIKVQAASLSGEECPDISWDEFQVEFSLNLYNMMYFVVINLLC